MPPLPLNAPPVLPMAAIPISSPPGRRRVLAVDGHSMFYAQQKVGWFFDPRRLLEMASADPGVQVTSAFWYAGLKDPTDQRPFRDALTSLGFTVRTRPLRELPGSGHGAHGASGHGAHAAGGHGSGEAEGRHWVRANLDVEIAIDLMAVSHRCEEVWLLSGSRDIDRLVEVLRARGLHITLISTEGMVARELRNAADRFIDLSALRPRLVKLEAAHPTPAT
jgi:uncharacterized LabA/DUF88 family protein